VSGEGTAVVVDVSSAADAVCSDCELVPQGSRAACCEEWMLDDAASSTAVCNAGSVAADVAQTVGCIQRQLDKAI
jgi:hypothetical protein